LTLPFNINSLIISEVTASDIDKLRDISIKTFSETYESLNTPENFAAYIQQHFNTEELIKETKNKNSVSYLARINDEVVGYLKLNSENAQTENISKDSLEIERIYVLKKYHGFKVGLKLLDTAVTKAKELQKKFIWLGVWEKNEKAIYFYKKNSFVQFDTHIFKLGDDDQNDFLFKLNI